jgi:hypothetical protein
MSRLERRTWWLLRAYPRSWRDERGQELVGTVLDLSGPGRPWPSPAVAIDLVAGGWTVRARQHRRDAGGWLAAGWRAATLAAVVLQVAVSLAWGWHWSTSGFVPMLPVLSNASAVTFLLALAGFTLAAVAWLAGQTHAARWLSGVALGSWAVTVLLFQMVLSGGAPSQLVLVAWTYLAVLATWALWQPRPSYPATVAIVTAAVAAATLWWVSAVPDTEPGYLRLADTGLFTRPNVDTLQILTLQILLLAGWALAAVIALLAVRRDPRPITAVAGLLPFALLTHPPLVIEPLNLGVAVLSLVVLAAAASAARLVDRAH